MRCKTILFFVFSVIMIDFVEVYYPSLELVRSLIEGTAGQGGLGT